MAIDVCKRFDPSLLSPAHIAVCSSWHVYDYTFTGGVDKYLQMDVYGPDDNFNRPSLFQP